MYNLVFKEAEEPQNQTAKEFQKKIYFCFIDYTRGFDWGSQQTAENSSRDVSTRSHVSRSKSNSKNQTWNNGLVQNWERSMTRLYTVMSPCLFNLYAEYIMQNAKLDESQAGIQTARRNINNLRYADDTTNGRK